MAVHDRIRLTGLLREGPASAGPSYFSAIAGSQSDMPKDALETYLNDHLAGATLGSDHAHQLEKMAAGTPLGDVMTRLAAEIDEDREELVALMERLDAAQNPVKKAGAWVMEKAGRPKFSGATSGDRQLGIFVALETLSLGVAGKLAMWEALTGVRDRYPGLAETDLDRLGARAREQRETLERERLQAAVSALG